MGYPLLKTALLGLTEKGIGLLEAAAKSGYFQIQAVADRNTDLVKKTAEKYDCLPFDDYRQLIIQNQLDVLLVAAPIHTCIEHIKAAMEKKFNVLKLAPPARDFEETAELARIAKKQDVTLAVSNLLRFAPGFGALRDVLQGYPAENIFLITVLCPIPEKISAPWQTDPNLAGGGILLHCCYEMIDQLVLSFSIPQQLYSLNTNLAGDKQQRHYLTEDTAVITMKFSDSLVANLIAGRKLGQNRQVMKIYGKDRNLAVTTDRLVVRDTNGRVVKDSQFTEDRASCMTGLLENFALNLILPEQNKLLTGIEDNLPAMAVINSAYLSARTAMPEEPARIMKMP